MPITNEGLRAHTFLLRMHGDGYFPTAQVNKGAAILTDLCEQIESSRPTTLDELYKLTHAATERFNALAAEFDEHGSDLETEARAAIAEEFRRIASACGFAADSEELIATREW